MSFFEQIKAAADSTAAGVAALSRLMASGVVTALLKCRGGELCEWREMVIAGVILIAKKRKTIYRRKVENLREVVAREEIQRTFTEW